MAYSYNTRLVLVACFVVIGLVGLSRSPVHAQTCKGADFQKIMGQCGRFVQISGPKIPPSPGCCEVLKEVDVPCVCKNMREEIEKVVSMEKAVYVATSCGIKLESGTKCGSYTVPPLRV